MAGVLVVLDRIAAPQLGLVTREQLRHAGLTDRQVSTLVARRQLRRVRPRVFVVAGAPDSWERALLAGVLSVGDGAVASHASAARLWGFAHRPEDRLEVTTRRTRRARRVGVTVHRTVWLDDRDVVHRFAVRCTSFERTLCDCSTRLSPFQLGRVLDDGLRRGVATLRRVEDCVQRLESAPGRHMSVVRSLLGVRGVGYDPGGSASELRVLAVLRKAGLPLPVQQYRVSVGGRTYRLDYAWPEHRVFAEYYGLAVHSGASAVAYDSDRITALSVASWRPLVFTDASRDEDIERGVADALGIPYVGSSVYRIGA